MLRVTVRHQRAVVSNDRVLVTEARAAHAHAARVHVQNVVEARRREVAAVGLEDDRLDAVVAQRLVAAGKRAEVLDARDLEPDEVGGVVRDPLRVGLGEAHAYLGLEAVVLETHVRYLEPTRFDDRLQVYARCLDVRGARFRYEYAIERDGRLIADGWTAHATVDGGTMRPTRVPSWLQEAIASAESSSVSSTSS